MKEIIIQCGITYQPLTIAIDLISKKTPVYRVQVLSTFEAGENIKKVLEQFFPHIENRIVYGELVSGRGSGSDQSEFSKNIDFVLKSLKYDAIFINASGTNWMTHLSALKLSHLPSFVVQTKKEFQDKCFLPEQQQITADADGNVVIKDGFITRLQPVKHDIKSEPLNIVDKSIHFLDHQIPLTVQEAAVFEYLIYKGSCIDLADEHLEEFNAFCENKREYDNYRVVIDDDFPARFKQIVSKINAKIEAQPSIVAHHLYIFKEFRKKSIYRINFSI